jgi:hypothetical protein
MTDPNGRVNILGFNPFARFQMHDKISTQRDTSYRAALTGNWQDTPLSCAFFSAGNVRILQNGIKAGVHKKSNGRFQIADQDEDTLKIIMRSVFLQHATNQPTNITGQISALNKIVLDYSVPQVLSEAQSYVKYKNDVSTLVVPIQRPVSTYSSQTLEFKKWF